MAHYHALHDSSVEQVRVTMPINLRHGDEGVARGVLDQQHFVPGFAGGRDEGMVGIGHPEHAAAHGGQDDVNPVQDHGFMYGRDLADPDGHRWGVIWMDPAALPAAAAAA